MSPNETSIAPLILVIEEDPQRRALLLELLCARYRVELATGHDQGLAMALELQPDLVILQARATLREGRSLLEELQRFPLCRQWPMLLLTPRLDEALREQLLSGEMLDYLLEPWSPADQQMRLEGLLSRRRLGQVVQRRERELFQALLEGSSDGLFVKDLRGHFVLMNPAMTRLLNVTSQSLIGRDESSLMDLESREIIRKAEKKVFAGRVQVLQETLKIRGWQRTFLTTRSPLHDEGGQVVGLVGVTREVTERQSVAESLALQERRYQSLTAATAQIIWSTNARGQVVESSASWSRFTGKPLHAFLGDGGLAHIHVEDQSLFLDTWKAALESQSSFHLEYRLGHHTGTYRRVVCRGVPVLSESGELHEWVGSCSDVEDQRRMEAFLRKSNQRWMLLAEVSSELLHTEHPLEIIDSLCQRALKYLECDLFVNYLLDPATGRLRLNSSGGLDPELVQEFQWMALEQATCNSSPECSRLASIVANPFLRPLGLSAYACHPLRIGGKLIGTLGFGTRQEAGFSQDDLAVIKTIADHIAIAMDRVAVQKALRKSEEEARQAKDLAEKASHAKDHLLAVVSHELRTPLNPVLAVVSYLQEQGGHSESLREDLRMIRRNIEQEARIVDDLLDLTRLARGKIELHCEVLDLHQLITTVLRQFQMELEQRQQKLLLDLHRSPVWIWGDMGRMQQVLANLLTNAIKFTPEQGCITIQTRPMEGGEIQVAVIDTGIGLEAAVLDRIFNAFEQGDIYVARQFGGLGLGLAISKGIVTLHGGRIWAQSPGPGKGAAFYFALATMQPLLEGPGLAQTSKGIRKGSRILLVEDHADTIRIMTRLLESLGCHVTTASSVAEAMGTLEKGDFDLLISDIGLPDGSGLQIMSRTPRAIPGIALSGFGQQDDLQKSRAAGFLEHLVKPLDFQKLEAVLQRLLPAQG